jgi:periplasmic divalent cation tolerance protein
MSVPSASLEAANKGETNSHAPDPTCVMILSTVPDSLIAKRIAHFLVEEHLAACVQITPPMLSIYEWSGEVQGDEEVGLVIKTSRAAAAQAIDRLISLHPYEVPQATVIPIMDGYAPYLSWVSEQTQGTSSAKKLAGDGQ